ncbi:MAG: peptidase S10 [Acidobacteriota bacterium]|nr:peptidase S10 [Acidobacteriota bacterium]
MKLSLVLATIAFSWFLASSAGVRAQEPAANAQPTQTAAAKPGEAKPVESTANATETAPKEQSSVTQHSARIAGQNISYTATASTTLLKNDKGEPEALMYSTAYTENGVKDLSRRPIAFLYNGGPGSSSVWLHMGAYGPRRVATGDASPTPPAPYQLVDNEYSLLNQADLVFIDPVGTGFSHAAGKAKDSDFWGVQPDVQSLAQFISIYLSRNHRWNSPKLLIGESYGTFRSVALCHYLQDHEGIYINGVVLMSSVLDLGTLNFTMGDDRSFILYLPTYAAIAWHYDLLKNRPADLPSFLEQVRQFASSEYADALLKGGNISDSEKQQVAAKVSAFTGLDENYVFKSDLRVNIAQFRAELLRSRRLTIGRYDARYNAATYDVLEEYAFDDPSYNAVLGAFTAAFNSYVRDDLKFGEGMTYKVLPEEPSEHWNWKGSTGNPDNGFPSAPNVEDDLVHELLGNAYLQVQVENGYFDLATPFYATEFTMNHLLLPKSAGDRIHLQYYEAGHMMYLHVPDLEKLSTNVRAFISQVSQPR